jgi:hypothetical protein
MGEIAAFYGPAGPAAGLEGVAAIPASVRTSAGGFGGSWYYDFRRGGFAALQRQPRKDKGIRKALSPEAAQALLEMRRQHPNLKIKVIVRQLLDQGVLPAGAFSLPSVYRLLAEHGLDSRGLKNNPHLPNAPSGPTKSFECALANELWMTDLMFGPTLRLHCH